MNTELLKRGNSIFRFISLLLRGLACPASLCRPTALQVSILEKQDTASNGEFSSLPGLLSGSPRRSLWPLFKNAKTHLGLEAQPNQPANISLYQNLENSKIYRRNREFPIMGTLDGASFLFFYFFFPFSIYKTAESGHCHILWGLWFPWLHWRKETIFNKLMHKDLRTPPELSCPHTLAHIK